MMHFKESRIEKAKYVFIETHQYKGDSATTLLERDVKNFYCSK